MLGRLATEKHIRCPGEDSRPDHADIGRIFWVAPPWSTRMASPDWKLGSPANMARTTLATSSGVAARPLGFIPASRLLASACCCVGRPTMGGSVSHGQTAKTRMFSLAKPAATDWVMLITPACVAPKRIASGNGRTVPTNDEVL